MSDTQTAPATTIIESTHNGRPVTFNGTTLTKGKGKGRYIIAFDPKYSSSVDAICELIRTFPESVGHIYKHTFRAAALAASNENVKSAEEVDEHNFTQDMLAEWNVSRATDPIKLAEEDLAEFLEANAHFATLINNFGEVQRIIGAAQAGDPTATEQVAQLQNYSMEYQSRQQRINKLRAEKKTKSQKRKKV